MDNITDDMKVFFGRGEVDVDLMLQLGLVKPGLILYFYQHSPDSPGYNGIPLPGYTE